MPLVRRPSSETPVSPPVQTKPSTHLFDGTDEERWTAARDASELPDGLSLLGRALTSERVPRVREAIFTGLAKIGTPEAAAEILPYLRSDDAAQRTAALDALNAMPSAAGEHLPRLLKDADPDVRLLACEIARRLPADQSAMPLIELIEREDSANVCAAAVEVLTEIGDPSSLPALARCGARFPDDPFLAFAIKAATDRIGAR
jgi:HEAT repeat protein